jgi:ammonia channel protein AmtB
LIDVLQLQLNAMVIYGIVIFSDCRGNMHRRVFRFWSWALFVAVWGSVVYFPVAHWVFRFDGFTGANNRGRWIASKRAPSRFKAEEFAGGTAVHINAGAAGFA